MIDKAKISVVLVMFTVALVALWSGEAASYERYSGGDAGCAQCHNGFEGGFSGPLHIMHRLFIDDCKLCHVNNGDNPLLDESGTDPNYSCNGCHEGTGLRAHHANAGAPTDGAGLLCAACHPGDPTPPSEDTAPPYYGLADVAITEPCKTDPANGGEDYSGDGKGLDNDGDLLYEVQEPDCDGIIPVNEASWGILKAYYEMD